MNNEKILQTIEALQKQLTKLSLQLQEQPTPNTPTSDTIPTPDINDKEWPKAIAHTLNTTSPEPEKQYRALQIQTTLPKFHNQSILELGCGEGHLAQILAHNNKHVTAHDPVSYPNWNNTPQLTFTIDLNDITELYDHIIIIDVLDHLQPLTAITTPLQLLQFAKQHLTPTGQIHLSTHPWTSRHGAHQYHTHNKAYIHLALTPQEQQAIRLHQENTHLITYPQATYKKLIHQAKLQIQQQQTNTKTPETYIQEKLLPRIKQLHYAPDTTDQQLLKILTVQTINYTLTHAQ
jgi:2-polyprenyl-3-methyl-5-hydroxy-6-metoxy-1,4-benzoquinol methylase